MASGLINARIGLAGENRRDQNSLYYYFDRAHQKRGDADCYVCEDQTLSFNQVAIGQFFLPLSFNSSPLETLKILSMFAEQRSIDWLIGYCLKVFR